MKISKRQLRRIIKEEVSRLLEYEQHVYTDKNGVTWLVDDEGNRERKSSSFGRQYGGGGGQTYRGTRPPWRSRSRYRPPRKTSYVGTDANAAQIAAIEAILEVKPNNFLTSVLTQLKKGRGLSAKQKTIVRKIIAKTAESAGLDIDETATLFENRRRVRYESKSQKTKRGIS